VGGLEGLRKRQEFQRVYTQGVKVVGRFVAVFALARGCEGSRLGITATKKLGGAVVRNRCRRRVRELARRQQGSIAAHGWDVVVNVRFGCEDAPWPALQEDFLQCLRKAERRMLRDSL
jgi:ribonuclease P protein component